MSEAKAKTTAKIGGLGKYAPIIGLVLVIVVFTALTGGGLLSVVNLQNMANQVIVTALVAIGAVFVYGVGNFDMSLGGAVLFSAVLGAMAAVKTGSIFAALIVCIVVSAAIALVKGLFSAYIEVPFFIFTIVLGSVISSVVLVIMGSETTIYLKDAAKEIPSFNFTQMTIINVICLVAYFAVCLFLFNYTPIGSKVKMMGGNKVSAKQSGINDKKMQVLTFLISSIGIALAAFILIIRTRTIGSQTAGSTGTDVMIALVLGGMPISGGPKSKISAGLVGALIVTILNSGLTMIGLSTGVIQIVRGIVFIIVVLVASFSYRGKLLPR